MSDFDKNEKIVPIQTLRRLTDYLNLLKSLDLDKISRISAPVIAKALDLNEVQVRKDLAYLPIEGRPKTGFELGALILSLERFLGYDNVNEAVLVGVGHLGRALLSYKEFETSGLKIVVGFDNDEEVAGKTVGGKQVFPVSRIPDLCHRLGVHIGIIAVPAPEAQKVCDMLVEAGILAIWNFAPVHLSVPESVLLQNENLAASLTILSKRLWEKLR